MVVGGGFFLAPNPTPFEISVYVHGDGGEHDAVPKDSGDVVMKLGSDVRRQQVAQNGEVFFTGVPQTFRGQEVPIWFESKIFETDNPDQKYPLKASTVSIAVHRKPGRVSGRVEDENGQTVQGAIVQIGALSEKTDSSGQFTIGIPADQLKPDADLSISAQGYKTQIIKITPNANSAVVQLNRLR
jgi:carboxypeptidase family protein